jgi:aspartate/methionine/tyrosine aminotransferase
MPVVPPTHPEHLSVRGQVEPFHVMEVLKPANASSRSHGDVITMCAGQPSTPAPRPVREAARAALATEAPHGYVDALGVAELREAIAGHHERTHGVRVDPARIAVTTGSSAAFTAVFLAAFDAGDVVLMTRPGYPAYRNGLRALGCRAVELDCGPDVRFQPTLGMLLAWAAENGGPPRGLVIASPANPTGTLIDPAELEAIAQWCEAEGVLLVSDEIYHGITFGEPARTASEFTDGAVVVGSTSKYFSMTGWRVGWAILPDHLVRPVELLLGNLNICAPSLAQVAAVEAFTPEARAELDGHVARYAANRAIVLDALPGMGVDTWAPADGAFYAYADVSHLTGDSLRWCFDVLDATGVAVTPGVDFAPDRPGSPGPLDGSRWFRLSFAGSTAEVTEAMSRLTAFARSAP